MNLLHIPPAEVERAAVPVRVGRGEKIVDMRFVAPGVVVGVDQVA
jgi:hypothetical protein